ncbi:hypothetical protein AAOE16_13870 [Ekhidna sp. MALMAid0563]|uniref:hypothetical protein n=1 Tax=Ekhidna sp. MALMAid0563 TaxID=3143937 RepID=UPI0032DEFC9A
MNIKSFLKNVCLIMFFAGLLVFSSCIQGENEITSAECSNTEIRVYESYQEQGIGFSRQLNVFASNSQSKGLPELTVTASISEYVKVIPLDERNLTYDTIPAQTIEVTIPASSDKSHIYETIFKDNSIVVAPTYSVEIIPVSCDEVITKDDEEIKAESDAFRCDESIVDITVTECEGEYTFSWEAVGNTGLAGYEYQIYGKTINLGGTSPVVFATSDLDFSQEAGVLVKDGVECGLLAISEECNNEVVTGTTGVLTINEALAAGEDLSISLTDADLNQDENTAETTTVTVTTTSNDTETVTLTETGANTGIFEGTLNTALGSAGIENNNTLEVEDDIVVTVTYTDALDATGNELIVTQTVTVANSPGTLGTLTINPTLEAGETLSITLQDADLATDGSATITVTTSLGETENVSLTEDTDGIFIGTLTTLQGSSAGTDNDGFIVIEDGVIVTVTYNDTKDDTGIAATVSENVTATGSTGPPPSSTVNVGGTDYDVSDADYSINTAPNPDEMTITITSAGMIGLDLFAQVILTSDISDAFPTGTYTFNATNQGVSNLSSGSLNDVSTTFDVTGGTVDLTDNLDGTYTIELNLTTTSGTFTGTVIEVVEQF